MALTYLDEDDENDEEVVADDDVDTVMNAADPDDNAEPTADAEGSEKEPDSDLEMLDAPPTIFKTPKKKSTSS